MSDEAPTKKLIEFHRTQAEFFQAVKSEQFSYLLYGGAIQGGKTTCVLSILILLCRIFPRSRWAVVRKDEPSLLRNTIPSFNLIRPPEFISAPSGKGVARCANGSEIIFFPEALHRDPDYDRWKGLMVNGFVLEEANELAEGTFNKAIERAGTWNAVIGRKPKPVVLLTCNPARNWVMTRFYLPWKKGTLRAPYYFQRALPADNPHLTMAYRESLKNLPPAAYKRFVQGDWDVLDDPQQLILFEWLVKATTTAKIVGPRYMGVDVARFGDDYSSKAFREGNALVGMWREHGLDTQQLADQVALDIQQTATPAHNVRIDGVGLGAGVIDRLRVLKYDVKEFIGSHKAPHDEENPTLRFKNKRAWSWWHLREQLRLGKMCIDVEDTTRLFQDLASPRYMITGDKVVEVESKDDLKKRIGRSPDEGDAVVMAWADDPNDVDLGWGETGMGDGSRHDPALG